MQKSKKTVDVRVYDRLPDQGQRAVPNALSLLQPVGQDPGKATHGLDQVLVVVHEATYEVFGVICLPAPLCAHRILVVPPAEHALVGASERGRGLHALIRGDSVKGVFVAAAAAP
jgi:hypothetical protein